ncbi:MAG: cytochrome c3 family protein [Candidatus Polarisedimenticolaceae bacterium]|nr:cytochrome c3 family protein [Candidatus Polarisedimenticolaceae bacterium]
MKNIIRLVSVLLLVLPQLLLAASIVGSKHDLGPTNYYGGADATTTNEICVFCHTPHNANISQGPLWNRRLTDTTVFQVYTSPTMDATCAATPSALSLACLSCHDVVGGGGAVGGDDMHRLVNSSNANGMIPSCLACHNGIGDLLTGGQASFFPGQWWQIGPDLRNDHPVSIIYADALSNDPSFNTPPDPEKGWADVKLFNGRVECPSCHNPHDPENVPFLRKSNDGSALCMTCHNK